MFTLDWLLRISINLAVVVTSAIFGMVAWRRRKAPGMIPALMISIGGVSWSLGSILVMLIPGSYASLVFHWMISLGVSVLPIASLALMIQLTRVRSKISGWAWVALGFVLLSVQVVFWAPALESRLQADLWLRMTDSPIEPSFAYSIWDWFYLIIHYSLLLVAALIMVSQLSLIPQVFKLQRDLIIIGTFSIWIIYAIEITPMWPSNFPTLSPLLFTLGQALFLKGASNLFDILALSRGTILKLDAEDGSGVDTQPQIIDFSQFSQLIGVQLANNEPILLHDKNGRIVYASQTALDSLDLRSEQVVGQSWCDLDHSGTVSKALDEAIANISSLNGNNNVVLEKQINGSSRFFELSLQPFTISPDIDAFLLTSLRDVTEFMNSEAQLRTSEKHYRQVVEGLQEGIVIQDGEGKIIACNPSAEKILGLSVDSTLGKIFVDNNRSLIHEDGSPFPSENHPSMAALRDGNPRFKVVMGIIKSGCETTWVSINSQPLFTGEQTEPTAVVSTYVDITESKRTETILDDNNLKFKSLIQHAPVAILLVDEKGVIKLVNPLAELMFGYSQEEMVGKSIEILMPSQFRKDHKKLRLDYIINPETRKMGTDLDLTAIRKDKTEFPVDIGLNTIKEGESTLVVCYIADLTERKNQEETLRKINSNLEYSLREVESYNQKLSLMGEMWDLLLSCNTLDEASNVIRQYVSQLFSDHSGALYLLNEDRQLVEAVATWGVVPPSEKAFRSDACWALRRSQLHTVVEDQDSLFCDHVMKEEISVFNTFVCVPMQAQGKLLGVFHLRGSSPHEELITTVAESITMALSNITLREMLHKQSIRDPLTGLYNRRFMQEALDRELRLAERYNRSVGMVMFDIDHFKEFNDSFGHAAGDTLLCTVSLFLQSNLRTEDIACRYGGEEFIVILPDTTNENARSVAEKIMEGIHNLRVEHHGNPLGMVTVSMGVASYREHGKNAGELLEAADKALYQAKQSGRNRVEFAP